MDSLTRASNVFTESNEGRHTPIWHGKASLKANAARGAVFRVPVTIIKPEPVANGVVTYRKALTPGAIARRFLTPPVGATWADVVLSRPLDSDASDPSDSNSSGKLYMVHVMQFEPFVRQTKSSFQKAVTLRPGDATALSFDVTGGLTMELCVAQFWSVLGDSSLNVDVKFHSIQPDQTSVHVAGGAGGHKVTLLSTIASEPLSPQASLAKWVQRLRPQSADISPLSSARDLFPDQRQVYQLVLTYALPKQPSGKVTPRFPALQDRLYESLLDGQLSLLFDANKQFLGASDAYADDLTLKKKGDYLLRTQLRHEDVAVLAKLKALVLFLEHDVKSIAVPVYGHPDDATLARKPLDAKSVLSVPLCAPQVVVVVVP